LATQRRQSYLTDDFHENFVPTEPLLSRGLYRYVYEKRCTVSNGIVKFFDPQKRYGIIQREGGVGHQHGGGGQDVLVHISAVQQAGLSELRRGQRVSFETVTYWKTGRPMATNLKTV
jgi:cold shock CspA family protein